MQIWTKSYTIHLLKAADVVNEYKTCGGLSLVFQVDCTAHSETCGHFGVTGYPTLKIFRYGKDSAPYDGPRTAGTNNLKLNRTNDKCVWKSALLLCNVCVNSDGIYNYMKKQTGPDSVYLKTKEDLQTFVNNYDASIVGMIHV